MTFKECVLACYDNRELVAEFDRLKGTNLMHRGNSLDAQIDFSSGKTQLDLQQFIEFVRECVWERIS